MNRRIFWSIFGVALLILLLGAFVCQWILRDGFEQRALGDLQQSAQAAAVRFAPGETDEFAEWARVFGYRFTLIGPQGQVVTDSEAPEAEGQSHADRTEVVLALEQGTGQSRRVSQTTGDDRLYGAARLSDGSVLRLSRVPRSSGTIFRSVLPALLLVVLVACLLAGWLARSLTRWILRPLEELDLETPQSGLMYAELSPLVRRIAAQNLRIAEQAAKAQQDRLSFIAITENMTEGLLMLDPEGKILSINRSAQRYAHSPDQMRVGNLFLSYCRDLTMREVVSGAMAGQSISRQVQLKGRRFQVLADPVSRGVESQGVILLMLDITDREEAEQNRQEFTANVSHELKTPLTTIAGYAEMLQLGAADAEESVGIAGKIHGEAYRMIQLIDDIIALSRLDENQLQEMTEDVDLYALSDRVLALLGDFAARGQVSLHLAGEKAVVHGSQPVLSEMVYNLVDNAIKYNRPGGSVSVQVESDAKIARIQVWDTGIGIPPEEQEKVFQRFYRVDRRRSRAGGGTGLGLSIVKHGARLHGAKISLESEPGEGTRVTLVFERTQPPE